MSERNADDNFRTTQNGSDSNLAQDLSQEEDNMSALLGGQSKESENDLNLYSHTNESSARREENPFSFKKFLSQDLSAQKNKGARKKFFTMPSSSTSPNTLDLSNHTFSRISSDSNSRTVSTTDKSSVLPDFVKDHLVVEECNQSRSSEDSSSFTHQSFPDLNLVHRNVHFSLDNNREGSQQSQISNPPDTELGACNFQAGAQANNNDERLSEFNSEERTGDINSPNRRNNLNHSIHPGRGQQRVQFSSSTSVPLDLPSYENNKSNQNLFIPFDLTAPAEETTSSGKFRISNETVSKSLPDFLSDGPIKKDLGRKKELKNEVGINKDLAEGLHNCRANINLSESRLPSAEVSSVRTEDRLRREIDLLRHQLLEKNRIIESLERDLELIQRTDQRETASLECALQEVENNLKQTAKRALNAEDLVLKLRQENKLLKSEISSLRSENVELRLGGYEALPSDEMKNQKIAKELRSAATKAEISLKSLLKGIENLRALADSMENSHNFQESKKHEAFSSEDSASGPSS